MTEIRDIPIIFSAPMVQALLDGRKTCTRRLAVTTPKKGPPRPSPWTKVRPTDLLWVRENITRFDKGTCDQNVWYWAGMNGVYDYNSYIANMLGRPNGEWPKGKEGPGGGAPYSVPCIHMPRWASRITLDVDTTKIERLQDITAEDAIAEGIENVDHLRILPQAHLPAWRIYGPTPLPENRGEFGLLPNDMGAYTHDPRKSFKSLWENLHGPGSWAANPELVALTVFVHRKSVRSVLEARGIDTSTRWAA